MVREDLDYFPLVALRDGLELPSLVLDALPVRGFAVVGGDDHLLTRVSRIIEDLGFRLVGAPIGLMPALAIEALLHGALTASFFVPGNIGVQEAAYVGLAAAFGVPPQAALSVSLLRRARDMALGIPILLAWQATELRGLRKATKDLGTL